jgi:hypothetical protein
MGDRVDGPTEGDADREVVASSEAFHGVTASARSFAHDGGALLRLQVKSEFFTPGEGLISSDCVYLLINKPRPGNPGNRPVLVDRVEIVNVRGLPEQIRVKSISLTACSTRTSATETLTTLSPWAARSHSLCAISPVDESACNPKPKSFHQPGRTPYNVGHNDLANDSAWRKFLTW